MPHLLTFSQDQQLQFQLYRIDQARLQGDVGKKVEGGGGVAAAVVDVAAASPLLPALLSARWYLLALAAAAASIMASAASDTQADANAATSFKTSENAARFDSPYASKISAYPGSVWSCRACKTASMSGWSSTPLSEETQKQDARRLCRTRWPVLSLQMSVSLHSLPIDGAKQTPLTPRHQKNNQCEPTFSLTRKAHFIF